MYTIQGTYINNKVEKFTIINNKHNNDKIIEHFYEPIGITVTEKLNDYISYDNK